MARLASVNGTGAFRLMGLSTVRMIKPDFGNVLTITGVCVWR